MDEFVVASHSDYARVVKRLYGDYTAEGHLIVFRGQSSEHRLPDGRLALIPSAFRSPYPAVNPKGLMPAVTRYLELYLKTADELTRRIFREGFGNRLKTLIEEYDPPSPVSALFHTSELTDLPAVAAVFWNMEFWLAVAQHYGLPTGLLDVTTDPDVALWFAVHKYTRLGRGRRVGYKPADGASYVYALRVMAEPRQVIPLSTFFFDGDTRPRRQQAALLSGIYNTPPDHLLERILKAVPRGAFLPRPAGNTFAEMVIARIVVEKAFRSPAVERPAERLFPCPDDDRLYARLLEKCDWVETLTHCARVGQRSRHQVMTPTEQSRPVKSRRELADDPSWFTILFVGQDADAALAYAWRCIYFGSPLGRFNLFERAGLNLIVATAEETKSLIMEAGVAVILFCDVGNSLIRSGAVKAICRIIARKQRVVVPVYSKLGEAERRFSARPFDLLVETATSEAEKVTRSICGAIELSWQLQRADAGSTCRKQFTASLGKFSEAANRLH